MMGSLRLLLLYIFVMNKVFAAVWVVPEHGDVVGKIQYASPEPGETLAEVGIRFDIGYRAMVSANPKAPRIGPLTTDSRVIIPSQFILPSGLKRGIVINLAEYRLYYFPADENVVHTYPVGIGRHGWETPIGVTKVIAKERDPAWRPSEKLVELASNHGILMPDHFPKGSYNPLGRFALRLGWPSYLIHGTNQPDGIGERVSAGCIRMLGDDIEQLYELAQVGTPVRIIFKPHK